MKRNISQPVGFDGKELQGYFMISNKDAASAILNKLTGSQVRLWLYLMMIDTYADFTSNGETIYHSIPSPTEISFKLGVARDTVQKDMRKLKKLGLYDYRITNWQGHNSAAAKAKQESDTLKRKKSQSANQKSNGTGQGRTAQLVAHQDSGQTSASKPRHLATPQESQELNNPHQGLNNPSSTINTPQTQSGESEGLISPSQGLNSPEQRLNNLSQGLNNPQQGLNNPPQPSKQASDKGSESSQTIQTYTDFIKTLSDSERERFFEFVEEKTKNFPHPIMDLEAWLAKPNSAGRNRWDIYYQRFVKATTPPSPPKQNRPLRDEIERQRLEAMEYHRKEAELKAAQGIEENPDPEDNRDILQIEERKGAKKDEMKSKINVECSRDVKTESGRSFKDHPLIHDEVNTPTKPERSYRKE